MKIFWNLFLALCHTAWLFKGCHLIGRFERCHVILNMVGNSFYCRSRTASKMTCKLGITFVNESEDFFVNKIWPEKPPTSKVFLACGNRWGKRSGSDSTQRLDLNVTWTRNEKYFRSGFKHDMFGRLTFEFWGAIKYNVGVPLPTKTWPKPKTAHDKSLAPRVDCFTAWSIWPDLFSHSDRNIHRKNEIMQFKTLKNNS